VAQNTTKMTLQILRASLKIFHMTKHKSAINFKIPNTFVYVMFFDYLHIPNRNNTLVAKFVILAHVFKHRISQQNTLFTPRSSLNCDTM